MSKFHPEQHLLVIEDLEKKSTISLGAKTYSIGRNANNAIILNSPQISRYHATLLRITIPGSDCYQFRIIDGDLNGRRSRNGIRVNNKICFSYDLQDGDVITFYDRITATYYKKKELLPVKAKISNIFFEEEEEEATSFLGKLDSNQLHESFQTSSVSENERQALIQQSLERLASFPELFSDPIIEIDLRGNITYLNPAALKIFPTLKKQQLKHPIIDGIISLAKTKQQKSLVQEVTIGEQTFEQSIHFMPASKLVRCFISDITQRKKAEILLEKAHQELENRVQKRTLELAHNNEVLKAEIAEREKVEQEIRLLQTITQAISETTNFDNAIAVILHQVCKTVGWSFGEAWIPDNLEKLLRLSPSYYSSTEKLKYFREASQKFAFSLGMGIPGRVWSTQQPEWSEDISIQPEQLFLRNKIARIAELRTALGVPIIAHGNVIAVLVFFDRSALAKNKQTIKLITSVAAQLGLIVERKQAEDALHSSMATNKAILDAIPDLIFRIDKSGIFVNYKAAKGENLLTPKTEFLGRHIYEVLPEEISSQIMDCIEKTFETGETQIFECQVSANNKVHSYEIRIVATEKNEVMAIVRDITERKQAEADIRRTLEQEKNLNELKSRFVTMASHEFRTPLASILSSSELIEHYGAKWSEEKKLTHLYRIQASVKHMTELLNDVLLLGKSDAGKITLSPTKINLPKFCRDLVEEIQLTSQTHQIVLQIENCLKTTHGGNEYSSNLNDESSINAFMDRKILRHILSNLLSNAIKYSPESERVNFDLICQAEQAIFQIQDFGIGVPPSEQDRLFDSFHRAKNVGSIPGTGLGLPIVKRSIDLHGGTIEFVSEIDVGSTFTVTLPYLSNH